MNVQRTLLPIAFRAALAQDFEYCRRIYFAEMQWIIDRLGLNQTAQEVSFEEQWQAAQVRIIMFDQFDVGWLQTITQDAELFVAQLFVEGKFQRRGIGTGVMDRLIAEASRLNQAVALSVVRINPAVHLYKRLGFQITAEDDRKFYMRRSPDNPTVQQV
jgi:ribosomal protein S18 acetylase RimI-like enzyme